MMEMYKTMMGNPEMYEMMMNMINGESSKMKHDMMKNSTNESEHKS
ncbi:MAG: hypothetical protein IPJ03_18960 [Ignavibacteriales bacterium]|nr:hypothetical protein [Ignavibacteriales bacterium]